MGEKRMEDYNWTGRTKNELDKGLKQHEEQNSVNSVNGSYHRPGFQHAHHRNG